MELYMPIITSYNNCDTICSCRIGVGQLHDVRSRHEANGQTGSNAIAACLGHKLDITLWTPNREIG